METVENPGNVVPGHHAVRGKASKRIFVFLFLMCIMALDSAYPSEFPQYTLTIRVSPEDHTIFGKGKIAIPAGVKTEITPGKGRIRRFLINGEEVNAFQDGSSMPIGTLTQSMVAEFEYSAVFPSERIPEKVENVGVVGTNVVEPAGIMLLSEWYPALPLPCVYQLTVELPQDYEAVSESDFTKVSSENNVRTQRFTFSHPLPGITLVAGKYGVREEDLHGITLKTYFFPESAGLAAGYLSHAKEYITLYESLIGAFPYRKFSIVENTFQTGYSFPTFTLLGSQVIKLPFIVKTSLGHEILHQWFGNYVGVDNSRGNWAEGLTTYLADQWYEATEGRGAAYRKKIMIDYLNYVDPKNEISLREFRNREDFSTRAIGYGKGAMVFHMLRKTMGDEAFFATLRNVIAGYKYQEISWDQIERSFGDKKQEHMSSAQFFKQWVERKVIPSLTVTDPLVVFRDGHYLLSFDVSQGNESFLLNLPVRVVTEEGEERFTVSVQGKTARVEKHFNNKPLSLFIDEEYDVMRRLTRAEVPPVISAFTGNKENIVVIAEEQKVIYQDVAEFFKQQGYTVKGQVSNDEIKQRSLLLVSTSGVLYRRLFADRSLPGEGFVVKVYRNPLNPDKVIVIFNAKDREELRAAFKKIFHYGNCSYLQFRQGRNVAKETEQSESGIAVNLKASAEAVETRNALDLDGVVERIRDQGVIYIGESHTEYSHHVMQYEIIRRLATKSKRLIIGMEMFQRPFQKYLDQYVRHEISEEEFLQKTEYFRRWGFEYNLYRDILQFARAKQIPVIALNIRKEIVEKVAKEGIASLSKEEYAEIPPDMDMTNEEYRAFLKEAFLQHAETEAKDFDNFFQSQIIWDESMAHSVAQVMKDHPGSQVVILAGNGHLQYSRGIPGRVQRLTGQRGVVILNDGQEGVERQRADFVLFPRSLETPESPKLMVSLEEGNEEVVVKEAVKGGPAQQAGIKEGDIIKKIDDRKIIATSDIKILLLNKRKGDRLKVTIRRKGVIPPGENEMVLDIVL